MPERGSETGKVTDQYPTPLPLYLEKPRLARSLQKVSAKSWAPRG